MEAPMTFDLILQALNSVGAMAILVLFILGFIVPEKTHSKMIDEVKASAETSAKLVASETAKEIKDGIQSAIKEGIVAAVYEIRNGEGNGSE